MTDPDGGRAQLGRIGIALLVPIAVAGEWNQQLHQPFRWRLVLLLAVAGCAFAFAVRWRDLSRLAWRTLASVCVATILIAVWYALWTGSGPDVYDASRMLVPVLLGWMCALLLTRPDETGPTGLSPRLTTLTLLLGLGALTIVATVIAARLGDNDLFSGDEVLYLIQARRFADAAIVQPVEPSLMPFFLPYLALPKAAGFVPHFPPGWPAILSLFSLAGLREWSGPLLSAATVAAVFLLGKRLHSKEAGVVGALLLAGHHWFIHRGASYFSHTATMLLLVGAALLLLRVNEGEKLAARSVAAGFLLGWAIVARPLTGVALGTSVFLWSLLSSEMSWSRAFRITAFAAAGALIPGLCLLAFNNVATGHPFQLGYFALHGPLQGLGFGERGYVYYDAAMKPVKVAGMFTPNMALGLLAERISEHARQLLPSFMLLPLLAMASVSGLGPRLRTVSLFLILPFGLFFFFEPDLRLYSELLPFFFIGVGVLVARLHFARRLAWPAIVSLMIAQGLISAFALQHLYAGEREYAGSDFRFMDEVKRVQERRGPILVFVREPFTSEMWLASLNYYNVDGYDGDIVVARDLGAENERLIRARPNHTPFLLTRKVNAGEPPLVELAKPGF